MAPVRAPGHRDEGAHHRQEKGRGTLHEWGHLGQGAEVYRADGAPEQEGCRAQTPAPGPVAHPGRGRVDTSRGPPDTPSARNAPGAKSKYTVPPSQVLVGDSIVYETVNGAARGQDIHRQIFERNLAVQLLIDPETGRIVEANPAACAFYGYTREELIKRKITDINSLPVSEVHAAMGQATGERKNTFRFRHRLATGEVRDVEVHSGPIEVDGRRLLYSIIHDVTDSERAQAELHRTISLLQSTLDSTTDGILAIDRQGRIVSYNQRFARMWRIPPEVLESGDDEKAVAFAGEQLHAPEQFRREDPAGLRPAGPGELRHPRVQDGRSSSATRSRRCSTDSRWAASELPRRHRTAAGGSGAAGIRGQLPPALREPPHPDVGLRPERPPFLEVNESAVERYGYSRDELLAMRITDLAPGDDAPADRSALQRRPERSGESRHRRKDGTVIDVHMVSHVLDFAGPPLRSRGGPGHHRAQAAVEALRLSETTGRCRRRPRCGRGSRRGRRRLRRRSDSGQRLQPLVQPAEAVAAGEQDRRDRPHVQRARRRSSGPRGAGR